VEDQRWRRYQAKFDAIEALQQRLARERHQGVPLLDMLRRPDIAWEDVAAHLPAETTATLPHAVYQQVHIRARYSGYVERMQRDIERLRQFYKRYFDARPNTRYANPTTGFQSYFLTFDGGARLELMQRPDVNEANNTGEERLGYAHLAISVGSEEAVDSLTKTLEEDGYRRLSGPRRTGDGYYESVILDPDGNACRPGDRGEVVATSLDNRVMPFIRYRTGDLAVASSEACPCDKGQGYSRRVVFLCHDVLSLVASVRASKAKSDQ